MSSSSLSLDLNFATHEPFNLVPDFGDVNLYALDLALQEAVKREDAAWAHEWLMQRGQELGSAQMLEHGRLANKYPPTLKLFSSTGTRLDQVEFHPSYHHLMHYVKAHGGSCGPWVDAQKGSHVKRAALYILQGQVDGGTLCPTTMSYAVIPAIRGQASVKEWLDKALSYEYDTRFILGTQKKGITFGMGMTEKQGGSDVRANSTQAHFVQDSKWGKEYTIVGHKWFFSAVMCDAFLILAHTGTKDEKGQPTPSCFLLPRHRLDGSINAIHIQRLKDKLGDKSNVGTEVEFKNASAWLVGQEGRGIQQILEMGTYTRLDCALGSAATMRGALHHALHYAKHRKAFGKLLLEQPLMQNVLADIALEVEAAIALSMRLAKAFDRDDDENEVMLRRLLAPVTKYWVCKRAAPVAAECMEVWGGNGYVEDGPMAMYYRQAPLNSIWEGSGNVMGLDTLRALVKEPQSVQALQEIWKNSYGQYSQFDNHCKAINQLFDNPHDLQYQGRVLMQSLALATQAALLIAHAPDYVAQAFCQTRLGSAQNQTSIHGWGAAFGTLAPHHDCRAILQRAQGFAG